MPKSSTLALASAATCRRRRRGDVLCFGDDNGKKQTLLDTADSQTHVEIQQYHLLIVVATTTLLLIKSEERRKSDG